MEPIYIDNQLLATPRVWSDRLAARVKPQNIEGNMGLRARLWRMLVDYGWFRHWPTYRCKPRGQAVRRSAKRLWR